MKILLDFLPIILFFVTFKVTGEDIYMATGVAIVASVLQIGYMLLRKHKVDKMQWLSLAIIVFMGGLTLLFHDATFIKWKPTVLYWLFAAALLISRYVFRKNGIEAMMGKQIQVPQAIWDRANLMWVVFFAAMGLLNIWVAYNFDTSTWVNFKLFGSMGLTFAFVVGLALYLGKYSAAAQDVAQGPAISIKPPEPPSAPGA